MSNPYEDLKCFKPGVTHFGMTTVSVVGQSKAVLTDFVVQRGNESVFERIQLLIHERNPDFEARSAESILEEDPMEAKERSTINRKAVVGGALGGTTAGFVGCGYGIWQGGLMVLVGVLLCATGIGAIFGVPIILAGFVVPLLAGFIGGAAGAVAGAGTAAVAHEVTREQTPEELKKEDAGEDAPSCEPLPPNSS